MRVAVVVLRVEPDELKQLLDGGLDPLVGLDLLQPQWSADDGADGGPGIQRRVRILEDHLNVPAYRPNPAHAQGANIPPLHQHLPAGPPPQTRPPPPLPP